jgi:hypothetical protein
MQSDNETPTLLGSTDISSLQAKCIVQQPDHEAFYLAIISEQMSSARYGQSKVNASGPITCWESGCAGYWSK